MTINFDRHPVFRPPVRVFHGTRAPAELILKEGLRYPTEQELLDMIRHALERAGLSYNDWLDGQAWKQRKGRLTHLREMRENHRSKIWVTDRIETAWSYASRAPEIVSESVRGEIFRLYWRRKAVVEMADEAVKKAMDGLGDPIVVILDAKKIGARGGCNEPIAPFISPDAIVEILEKRTCAYCSDEFIYGIPGPAGMKCSKCVGGV